MKGSSRSLRESERESAGFLGGSSGNGSDSSPLELDRETIAESYVKSILFPESCVEVNRSRSSPEIEPSGVVVSDTTPPSPTRPLAGNRAADDAGAGGIGIEDP